MGDESKDNSDNEPVANNAPGLDASQKSDLEDKPKSTIQANNIKDVAYEEKTIQIIETSTDDDAPSADEILKKMRKSMDTNLSRQFFDPAANTAAANAAAKEPIRRGILMGILSVLGLTLLTGIVVLLVVLFRVDYARTHELTARATLYWEEFHNEWQKLGPDNFGGTINANDPELLEAVRTSLRVYKESLNDLASSSGLRNRTVNAEYEILRDILLDGFAKIDRSIERIELIQSAYEAYRALVASQLYNNAPDQLIFRSYEPLVAANDREFAEFYQEFLTLVRQHPGRIYIDPATPLAVSVVIEGPLDFLDTPDLSSIEIGQIEQLVAAQRALFFNEEHAARFTAALAAFDKVVFDHLPRNLAIQTSLARWRDQDRIDDIDRFMSRIHLYQEANRGRPPQFTDLSQYALDFLNLDIEENFRDPLTGAPYNFLNSEDPTAIGDIQFVFTFICDGRNAILNTDAAATNQSMALRIKLETGSFYCRDNQRGRP